MSRDGRRGVACSPAPRRWWARYERESMVINWSRTCSGCWRWLRRGSRLIRPLQLAVRRNLPPTGCLGEKLAVTPLVFGCHLRINFIKNLSKGSSSQRQRMARKKVNGRRGLSFIFSFAALQGDSICSMIGSFSISWSPPPQFLFDRLAVDSHSFPWQQKNPPQLLLVISFFVVMSSGCLCNGILKAT